MLRHWITCGGIALVVSMTASAAAAGVTDRVSVRATGGNHVEKYSPSLKIVAVSPADYARGCCYDANGGEWLGPPYVDSGGGGKTAITWGVDIAIRGSDVRKTMLDKLEHGWPLIAEGKRRIERRVGGRAVGTVPATWVLARSNFGGTSEFEGSMGFWLCGNVAVVEFDARRPSDDDGRVAATPAVPSEWNRAQVTTALNGVSLEGNLPGARVVAAARGRRVTGTVRDCHGGGVGGGAVTLEKKVGGGWMTVARGRASATGAFSLAARGAGMYRVAASAKRSLAVRVR